MRVALLTDVLLRTYSHSIETDLIVIGRPVLAGLVSPVRAVVEVLDGEVAVEPGVVLVLLPGGLGQVDRTHQNGVAAVGHVRDGNRQQSACEWKNR